MAISLYRKYRPNVFSDVVGQEHVEKTLVNAVREDNVAHAYLFCGPRGTGKTTTARLLAKALLCESGPTPQPCGTCAACQEIADGLHPDVYELDAASHTGVDNVRDEIISRVQFAPTHGKYKVYIIDEVHMLSTQAFNALLKTLEEPPAHVVFIMCTTEPHKVLDTIQSRCQRFDFRRFSVEEIVTYLRRICDAEGFKADTEALSIIAAKSNGGMRDATTALEQVAISADGNISVEAVQQQLGQGLSQLFDFVDAIAQQRTADCFVQIQNMVSDGRDLGQFSRDLSKHIRNVYVASIMGNEDGVITCPKQELNRYKEQAAQFGGAERLSHALTVCGDLTNELRYSSDARLSVEIACTRLCRPESDISLQGLAARVEQLENGAFVAGGTAARQVAAPARGQGVAGSSNVSVPAQSAAASGSAQGGSAGGGAGAAAQQSSVEGASAAGAVGANKASAQQGAAPQNQSAATNAASATDATTMSPARLRAAVLTEIKRDHVPTSALLDGVNFMPRGAGAYALIFPKGNEFMFNTAQAPDSVKHISQAFENVLGARVELLFEMEGAGEAKVAKSQQTARTKNEASAKAASKNSASSSPAEGEAFQMPATNKAVANAESAATAIPQDAGAAQKSSEDTAAELADMFSAFGDGISFEEV